MFGRKRSLPHSLQRRYLVTDTTEIVAGIIVVCAMLAALAGIIALFMGTFFDLDVRSLFGGAFISFGVGCAIKALGDFYIEYSHWADRRAVEKGRAISWGDYLHPPKS